MGQTKARSKIWESINGATGSQTVTAGGTFGSQSTSFAANPTEGDYITINEVVFTFYDNGNTPGVDATVEIEMAGSPALATSLAAAETLIEAHPVTGARILSNVDVTDTDSDLSFTWLPNVTGVMVTSTDGANTTDTAYSAGTTAVSINPAKSTVFSEWADASSTLTYLMLGDGKPETDGQLVEFYCASETTAGDTIGIIGSFLAGDNLATVTGAAGDGATFYWSQADAIWKMTKATNTALSNTNEVAL